MGRGQVRAAPASQTNAPAARPRRADPPASGPGPRGRWQAPGDQESPSRSHGPLLAPVRQVRCWQPTPASRPSTSTSSTSRPAGRAVRRAGGWRRRRPPQGGGAQPVLHPRPGRRPHHRRLAGLGPWRLPQGHAVDRAAGPAAVGAGPDGAMPPSLAPHIGARRRLRTTRPAQAGPGRADRRHRQLKPARRPHPNPPSHPHTGTSMTVNSTANPHTDRYRPTKGPP
jgi:hypothetical protein